MRAPLLNPEPPTVLTIGLLNNMSDAALQATERQFASLLKTASAGVEVRLRLFSLPGIPRGEYARSYMRGAYASTDTLANAGLDGLIITGAEPRAASLAEEAYWPALTRVIDWADRTALSSVWSCLAAHAAVLHLDGVQRQPLAAKCSGVFECHRVGADPMVAGLPASGLAPHSRLNGLAEDALIAHRYDILTYSPDVGVDAFVRRRGGLMLFLQGHPEYDADTLLREYRRDIGRFLRGERATAPATPAGYFDQTTLEAFDALTRQAVDHPSPAMARAFDKVAEQARPPAAWRPYAVALYRNWLGHLAMEKRLRASRPYAGKARALHHAAP